MGLPRELDEVVKKWSLLNLIQTTRRDRDDLVKMILRLEIKYLDEEKNKFFYDNLLNPKNQKKGV